MMLTGEVKPSLLSLNAICLNRALQIFSGPTTVQEVSEKGCWNPKHKKVDNCIESGGAVSNIGMEFLITKNFGG